MCNIVIGRDVLVEDTQKHVTRMNLRVLDTRILNSLKRSRLADIKTAHNRFKAKKGIDKG